MKATITRPDGTQVSMQVTPRLVPLDQIRLFSDVNRDVRQSHVLNIVRNFRSDLVQVLTVNHRNGVLRLIDGQHRYHALRELGVTAALSVVMENLTDEQEADLFVALNRGRLAVNAWDLWKQEIRAGHQDVIAIQRIVEEAGFRVARHSGPNHIQAVGALRRIYARGGPRAAWLLTQTLKFTHRMWLIDEHALDGTVLEGLATFLASFDADPNYEVARVEQVLALHPASAIIGKARKIVRERREEDDTAGGLNAPYIARAIVEFYNVGRPKTKLLGEPVTASGRRSFTRSDPRNRS